MEITYSLIFTNKKSSQTTNRKEARTKGEVEDGETMKRSLWVLSKRVSVGTKGTKGKRKASKRGTFLLIKNNTHIGN